MPKLKPHKGLLKRVRVTAKGKVKYHRSGKGHLLSHKPGHKRRDLRGTSLLTGGDIVRVEKMLHRPLTPGEKK